MSLYTIYASRISTSRVALRVVGPRSRECLSLPNELLVGRRDQARRTAARSQLSIWEISFGYARSQVQPGELRQKLPGSDYISPESKLRHLSISHRLLSNRLPPSAAHSLIPLAVPILRSLIMIYLLLHNESDVTV